MANSIEVFYSFQSPYSYLAVESIYQLENDFNIEVIWQPFSPKAAGSQPQSVQVVPEKLSYILESTNRYAKNHKIPLNFPSEWPKQEFDPSKITRASLIARDLDVLMEFNYKVFHKIWGLGEDPNHETFMNELCDELDIELGDFLSKLSSSDTRQRVRKIYQRGKKFGVFDTPTFLIDSERYVGLNSIPELRERLAPFKK